VRILFACLATAALVSTGCGAGSPASDASSPTPSASPSPSLPPGVTVFPVGTQPCGIAAAAGSLWVSDAAEAALYRVDPQTGAAEKAADLDDTPCEITVAFGSLWVVTQSGYVDRIDPRTAERLARIPVGLTSYQVVEARGSMWVSNRSDGTLTRIDPDTDKAVETVRTPGVQPGGMAFASGSLWIGDDTSGNRRLLRMDTDTGETTPVRSGGSRPAYLAEVDGDVWVSNVDDGTVSHINGRNGRLVATVEVGLSPVNLKPGPPGTAAVWVPDDLDDTVTLIDARSDQVIHSYRVGGGPAVVCAVDDDVWVTLFTAGALARITPS
jgi:streptogramin lyase